MRGISKKRSERQETKLVDCWKPLPPCSEMPISAGRASSRFNFSTHAFERVPHSSQEVKTAKWDGECVPHSSQEAKTSKSGGNS